MNILLTVLLWVTYLLSLYMTIYWVIVFSKEKTLIKKDRKDKIKLKRFPLISVIVPAYNEESTIIPVLNSILELDYPKNKLEIIVVNDGSTDNTKQKVDSFIKNANRNIKLIHKKNQGKAAALNTGLEIAKGEFFACLDADSFVDKNTLKKMLSLYEKETKDLAIITPAMKVKDPKSFTQKLQKLEYLVSLFIARLMSSIDCIYVAPGPFSLYRTIIIRKLGGFDVTTLTEDQEIAYRSQKHNYKIKQCHDGYVYTIAPKSFRGLYKQRNRWLKGAIYNIMQYRDMLFNVKYGDFGLMQMAINMLAFFLCITGLFFFSVYILGPFLDFIRDLFILNFNLMPFIQAVMDFRFNIMRLSVENIVIVYFLFLITFSVIYISHKNANECFKKRNIFILILYLFVYYLAISFIVIMVFFEILLDKSHLWKHS